MVLLENHYTNPIYFTVLFFLSLSYKPLLTCCTSSWFTIWIYFRDMHSSGGIIFASAFGATLAMLVSRYFIRDLIQKIWRSGVNSKQELDKYGSIIFALRMSPIFRFYDQRYFWTDKYASYLLLHHKSGGNTACNICNNIYRLWLNKALIHGASLSIELAFYLTILGVLPLIFKNILEEILMITNKNHLSLYEII